MQQTGEPAPHDHGHAPPPPPPVGVAGLRARTGRVVLTAFLVELAAVLALGNPTVSRNIGTYALSNPESFLGRSAYAMLTYSWRLTPLAADHQHIWLSQVAGLLTLFGVTALLILGTVRGPVTFLRALLTCWMAVVVAASFAGFMRRLVIDGFSQPGTGRFTNAVFNGPNSYDFFAGLLLGLVVGLIAGAVARSTQRLTGRPIDPAAAGGGIPTYGSFDGAGGQWASGTAPTEEAPRHGVPPQSPPDDFVAARRADYRRGAGPSDARPSDARPSEAGAAVAGGTAGVPDGGAEQTAVLPRSAGDADAPGPVPDTHPDQATTQLPRQPGAPQH